MIDNVILFAGVSMCGNSESPKGPSIVTRHSKVEGSRLSAAQRILSMFVVFLSGGALGVLTPSEASGANDTLEHGFRMPPPEAKPHTYWVWLNEYMHVPSALDELRAMKEAGLGGVLLNSCGARGDISASPPAGPAFLSAKWLEQLKFATREARNLGLQFDLAVTSSADMGGPWIQPPYGSKAIYVSETTINGGDKVEVTLPFPSAERAVPRGPDGRPAFWTDVAVLAMREPQRLSGHDFMLLLDPRRSLDLARVVIDQGQPNAPPEIAEAMSAVRDFSISVSSGGAREADFAEALRGVLRATPGPQTFELPAGTRGSLVRLRLLSSHDDTRPHWTIGEFELFDVSGRNLAAGRAIDKSGDGPVLVRYPLPLTFGDWGAHNIHNGRLTGPGGVFATSGHPAVHIRNLRDVVDITEHVNREGRLHWVAPPGRWTVLRYVCMITGEKLKVPGPYSNGLASDKLDAGATRMHMDHVIAQLRNGLGQDLTKSGLGDLYLPSYEPIGKSWTTSFVEDFRRRRGYDLIPYLPAMSGARVIDEQTTERFLFDYQKTLGELAVDAYYRTAAKIINAAGLKLKSEAGGPGPPIQSPPFDALLAHGAVDSVQGEFWPFRPNSDAINVIKEPASAAHLYGKRRVHLEAFTSDQHWTEGPQDLKASADRTFCEGGNHFVWHKWTHVSPDAGTPGWAYYAGSHLNRNVTWWPKVRPFLEYLARGSFMLQQGDFVGDVLYYYGDGGANFVRARQNPTSLGAGYDYDVTNAEVLLTRLEARNKRFVLPDGTSYALLVLPETREIHPTVLERIEKLVRNGGTVIGSRPLRASGLEGFPKSDAQVAELGALLWADLDGSTRTARSYGAGRVVWGRSECSVLEEMGISCDFVAPPTLDYTHRRCGQIEIYFVRNKEAKPLSTSVTFRDGAGAPEFWDPYTGKIARASVYRPTKKGTEVPLTLAAHGSILVVFRADRASEMVEVLSPQAKIEWENGEPQLVTEKAGEFVVNRSGGRRQVIRIPTVAKPLALDVDWTVEFVAPFGPPGRLVLPRIAPWTDQAVPEYRYFSGSGKYRHTFVLDATWRSAAQRVELDLGRLWSVGEVWLNNKPLGIVWAFPFRVDCTAALRDGQNELLVEVVGTWHNRLIGEARGDLPRLTRTNVTQRGLALTSPIPAGLFGPVQLIPKAVRRLE